MIEKVSIITPRSLRSSRRSYYSSSKPTTFSIYPTSFSGTAQPLGWNTQGGGGEEHSKEGEVSERSLHQVNDRMINVKIWTYRTCTNVHEDVFHLAHRNSRGTSWTPYRKLAVKCTVA